VDSLFVDGVSKCYTLGRPVEESAFSPKQLARTARRWLHLGGEAAPQGKPAREFWALKDVSFRVRKGTVLGVIGANGAGKSTLLKIIARVTGPTSGRIVGVGRVVSLLELGAGFNPELTARENIFMNAAMNGISKQLVLDRMDDLIAFAEVGEFIDTPLKYFSSGMYLRLAFSVAINMSPDILLADEILAVGDLAFQERCLQKVQQEAERGLTVLFVSHDMDAIVRVCSRVIWLNGGEVMKDGEPDEVVNEYQNAAWASASSTRFEKGRHINRFGRILSVNLVSHAGKDIGGAPITEDVGVRIRFETNTRAFVLASMDLYSRSVWLWRATDEKPRPLAEPGTYEVLVRVPSRLLAPTAYSVNVSLRLRRKGEEQEFPLVMYDALKFVAYSDEPSSVAVVAKHTPLLAPNLKWTIDVVAVTAESNAV